MSTHYPRAGARQIREMTCQAALAARLSRKSSKRPLSSQSLDLQRDALRASVEREGRGCWDPAGVADGASTPGRAGDGRMLVAVPARHAAAVRRD